MEGQYQLKQLPQAMRKVTPVSVQANMSGAVRPPRAGTSGARFHTQFGQQLLAIGGMVSVQALNELASVDSRKLKISWPEISEVIAQVRLVCPVQPLSITTHERAIAVAERYRLSFYDALIVAAALLAGCTTLYSEDVQDGQVIERKLTVRNPFR